MNVYFACKNCRYYSSIQDKELGMGWSHCGKYRGMIGDILDKRLCKKQNKKVYRLLLKELKND